MESQSMLTKQPTSPISMTQSRSESAHMIQPENIFCETRGGRTVLPSDLQNGTVPLKSVRAILKDNDTSVRNPNTGHSHSAQKLGHVVSQIHTLNDIVIEKRKIYMTTAECSQWGQFITTANQQLRDHLGDK